MATLTVVGERLAREGATFRYEGWLPACEGCKVRKVCHQLEEGRHYAVTEVRDVKHDVCDVFDGLVQVVEVEEAPIPLNVPASALRGTGRDHAWDPCGVPCPYKEHCDPPGLEAGTNVRFVDVEEDEAVDCKVGRDLRLARVEPTG